MLRSMVKPSTQNAPLEFTKMAGGGNDFVVLDHRSRQIADPGLLARKICTRRLSVGADGLILIEPSARATFRMRYFNSDGSAADFCANGTRCAARFAFLNVIAPRKMSIETDAGVLGAEAHEQKVTLSLAVPRQWRPSMPLKLSGERELNGSFLLVGVPHYVLFLKDDLWSHEIESLGREIRRHPDLQPAGANVDFVRVLNRSEVDVRTYERGVEGETLSCGSGVVASVAASAMFGRVDSPVAVRTRSGIVLEVAFATGDQSSVSDLRLTGDARVIYKSQLTPETLEGFDADWVRSPTA